MPTCTELFFSMADGFEEEISLMWEEYGEKMNNVLRLRSGLSYQESQLLWAKYDLKKRRLRSTIAARFAESWYIVCKHNAASCIQAALVGCRYHHGAEGNVFKLLADVHVRPSNERRWKHLFKCFRRHIARFQMVLMDTSDSTESD